MKRYENEHLEAYTRANIEIMKIVFEIQKYLNKKRKVKRKQFINGVEI